MELTVPNVYGLLLRSKLLPVDEAKALYARWQQEAGSEAGDVTCFASWMVAQKYLTEYQTQLLARGHAEGFFLNEYKILDRLGKGRMAGVYKAQHQLGQIVAIKVLPPSKSRDAGLLRRFQREARLALQLNHPNIVRAFQTGTADSLHYLVMEYLEGETMDDVLARRGKLPPAEAVRLIYQALQGLQHMHTRSLVHRDLKPSNLMLVGSKPDSTWHATVKILDIGLGRTLVEQRVGETADGGLTGEGVLLGTPDYMAPEQARDARGIDIRADIYSLGCVLYHLLAGHPPFPDTNLLSQMIRHASEAPRPLKEFNPAVPDGLQQILDWMLAKDPAQRYPTPERAAQALQVFLAADGEPPTGSDAAPPMRSYLTWLEGEGGKKPAAVASPPKSQPAGTAAEPARRPRQPPRVRPDKRSKKRSHPPSPAPVAAEPVEIDVEPVAMPPLASDPAPGRGWHLSRRDAVVFGLGAGAGALVTFAGYLIAQLSRPR
jgi:serine/threonine protein kinase